MIRFNLWSEKVWDTATYCMGGGGGGGAKISPPLILIREFLPSFAHFIVKLDMLHPSKVFWDSKLRFQVLLPLAYIFPFQEKRERNYVSSWDIRGLQSAINTKSIITLLNNLTDDYSVYSTNNQRKQSCYCEIAIPPFFISVWFLSSFPLYQLHEWVNIVCVLTFRKGTDEFLNREYYVNNFTNFNGGGRWPPPPPWLLIGSIFTINQTQPVAGDRINENLPNFTSFVMHEFSIYLRK